MLLEAILSYIKYDFKEVLLMLPHETYFCTGVSKYLNTDPKVYIDNVDVGKLMESESIK